MMWFEFSAEFWAFVSGLTACATTCAVLESKKRDKQRKAFAVRVARISLNFSDLRGGTPTPTRGVKQ
ncbi:hypothetical protein [Roseovarius aestuariivivens]|uniref:hypothetical protein n=1 Tax=Roseovarius aestuariivivens TaxID=1888910 RepID=UPI001082267B|nr:hypothetical protein [Roseovarius aestuariivivens]